MKSKVFVVLAVLAVAFMAAPAMAYDTYCSILNYNSPTSTLPDIANYGDVQVEFHNSGYVQVSITPTTGWWNYPDYDFSRYVSSAFLNVTGTVTNVTISSSGSDGSWSAFMGSTSADGLGTFNIWGSTTNSDADYVTFKIYADSGTWANAASVLAFNGTGFDAAANLTVSLYENWCWNTYCGYVGEGCPAVPVPPSALLMGSGLLGLVGLGWRRRRS